MGFTSGTFSRLSWGLTAIVVVATVAGLTAWVVGTRSVSAATTWTVSKTADTNDGVCNDDCSLREAIAVAAAGDTVVFDSSLSGGTITEALGTITISQDLTITGPAGGITVHGNNLNTVIATNSATVQINNLTITGGNATAGRGGGIYNRLGTLTLTNTTVSGNTTSSDEYRDGGGIYNTLGTVTLTNSSVSGNTASSTPDGNSASDAGGISNDRGSVILTNSTVSGNSANFVGGIYNSSGTVILTNSTVTGNAAISSAEQYPNRGGGIFNEFKGSLTLMNSTVSNNTAYQGGGIFNYFASVTLTNSTVSGNSASDGGGIYNNVGRVVTLTNSTVSGNTASEHGGGIFNIYGKVTLTHSTISDNSASHGGGIFFDGGGDEYGEMTLANSIVAKQLGGGDCVGHTTSLGYNIASDNTCNLTAASDQPNTDPLLELLANNGGPTQTRALQAGSPAIDKIPSGTNGCGTAITDDQRGIARPQPSGGSCDIGAYEVIRDRVLSTSTVVAATGTATGETPPKTHTPTPDTTPTELTEPTSEASATPPPANTPLPAGTVSGVGVAPISPPNTGSGGYR